MDKQVDSAPPIDELPNELLVHVFYLLERFSQIRLRRVCTRWSDVLRMYKPAVVKLDIDVAGPIHMKTNGGPDKLMGATVDRLYRLEGRQIVRVPHGTKYLVFTSEALSRSRQRRSSDTSSRLDDFLGKCSTFNPDLLDLVASPVRDRLVGIIYDNLHWSTDWAGWTGWPGLGFRTGIKVSLRDAVLWCPGRVLGGWCSCSVPVVCRDADVMVRPDDYSHRATMLRAANEQAALKLTDEECKKITEYWTSVWTADKEFKGKLRAILRSVPIPAKTLIWIPD